MIFLALSHAPPALDWSYTINTPARSRLPTFRQNLRPKCPDPTITGVRAAPGLNVSRMDAFVEVAAHFHTPESSLVFHYSRYLPELAPDFVHHVHCSTAHSRDNNEENKGIIPPTKASQYRTYKYLLKRFQLHTYEGSKAPGES